MISVSTTNDSTPADVDLTDPGSVWDVLRDALDGIAETFIENLPFYLLALVTFIIGVIVIRQLMKGVDRTLVRTNVDPMVITLTHQVMRAAMLFSLTLLALSVAGVEVSTAIATLGLAGLAIAFALQNILENFIAGILILIRKPFKVGDLVITHAYEGIVQDINLRVTRLHTVGGEVHLIPNAQVFANPITNLSELGARRSQVEFGIDYRNDHTAIPELIQPAIAALEIVLAEPKTDVLMMALGDSSVDFVVRFWTLPDTATLALANSQVLMTVKSTLNAAGFTIPWPIRTLAQDNLGAKR